MSCEFSETRRKRAGRSAEAGQDEGARPVGQRRERRFPLWGHQDDPGALGWILWMGSEAAWHPVPTSPPAGMEKRSKRLWGCCLGGCCAGGWILAVIFLGLYLAQELSSPAVRLQECQWELENQTSLARARSVSTQERLKALEAELKQARGEIHELWTLQNATNRSLAETHGRWETCHHQLETMGKNVTLQVTEAARHEAEKCAAEKQTLQQEISDQAQELKAAHSQSQEERDRCSAQTRELKAQLEQLSSSSSQISFGALATAFLLSGPAFLLHFGCL